MKIIHNNVIKDNYNHYICKLSYKPYSTSVTPNFSCKHKIQALATSLSYKHKLQA